MSIEFDDEAQAGIDAEEEEAAAQAADIQDRIREHRRRGQYAQAIPLARQLLAEVEADVEAEANAEGDSGGGSGGGTPWFVRDDARRLVLLLEEIASLPPSAQLELAFADSVDAVITEQR